VWLTPHLRDPQPEGERECIQRIRGIAHYALYKSTYLLIYLITVNQIMTMITIT